MRSGGGFSLAAFGASGLSARATDGVADVADVEEDEAAAEVPAESARGVVFLDMNGSGLADGQQGLAGMLVSNGVDIVTTDRDGRYEIAVREHDVLHLIKSRGFRTRVDAQNLPRFFHIHKPQGSPDADFIYPGVPPTGELPERVDFPVYPQEEPEAFEMILTADPQCYDLRQIQWYAQETTQAFRRHGAKFGIALGDIVGDHLDLYGPYNAINARFGFPWHNVIGNHDLNFMAKEDRFSAETFTRVFGPTTYAFQHASVHFIILNNIYWEGFAGLRESGWPNTRQYHGRMRPGQMRYIENYLQHVPSHERVVICSHIPLVNRVDAQEQHRTPELGELMKLLSGHPHTLSFSGHTHVNANAFVGAEVGYEPREGTKHHHCNLTATCGSWYRGPLDQHGVPFAPGRDGSPRGYAVVRFDGGEKYRIKVIPLGQPDDSQMSITLPSLVERAAVGDTTVWVNVFTGSDLTRVRMRVDDGDEWLELERTEARDPGYLALSDRAREHPDAGRGTLPRPVETDHLWKTTLPADLDPGWHTLTVQVRGNFPGDRWQEKRTFAVANAADDFEIYNQGGAPPAPSRDVVSRSDACR